MSFKELNIKDLNVNPVTMFSDGWAILTAGDKDDFNGMTVSWGSIGELWSKPCAFAFVRPQRYTREFCEKSDFFTLSFFAGKNRTELSFFGSKSGRDYDKFKETGLTAVSDGDLVYCEEAQTVLLCKKIAKTAFDPKHFYDETINDCYKENDYHDIYIGEIVKVLVKE